MTGVILSGKQAVFVAEVVANDARPDAEKLPDYQLAVRAGVAEKNAAKYAAETLAIPKIQQAIAERKRELAEASNGVVAGVDVGAILREWATIAFADPTRITQVRRLNCRHCWGFNFGYQYTDAEYAKETAQALNDAAFDGVPVDLSPFSGGPGFRITKDPNPKCPECDGEGVPDVHIADMRKLPPELRRLIASVEQTRNGVKVTMRNQDEALQRLAQWLGMLVNKNEHTGPNGGPIQTANVNYNLPDDPQAASRMWQQIMEGKV